MKVFFLYSKLSTNLFGIWLPQVISQMMLIYCSTIVWIKMNVMFEWGFPVGSVVWNLPAMQKSQEMQVQFLGWEDPLEEGTAIHSSVPAWKIP